MLASDKLVEIFRMQKELNLRIGVNTDSMNDQEQQLWILNYCRAISQEVAELTDSVPWKWWAKYQKFDKQNIRVEIIDLFHFLVSLAQVAGMSAEDVFKAYQRKHSVNVARQNEGYSVKDEGDNANI
jgi:dimeric dUTPase (all-alpha-NTP-PPase superfamily)